MKWLALVLVAGCAGRTGEILADTGDLSEAGGAPRIESIAELGGGDVILTAALEPAPGDGVATVGEGLWVRGSNFGRQPTVTIADRPAAVLARTTDGGLVARVPPGVPAGAQVLTVSNHRGRGDHALNIRRLVAALPPDGGRLTFVELTAGGPRAVDGGEAAAYDIVRQVRVTADGRAAYLLQDATKTSGGKLSVVELPAQGGPRRAGATLDLDREVGTPNPVLSFATAAAAPVLMIFRQRDLLLMDISAPLRPVRSQPRSLPPAIQKGRPVAAALSPDGKQIAVLLEEGNLLAVMDVRQPGGPSLIVTLALAPEARVPVVADVAFVPDGKTVWVALGDTVKSRAVGPQVTEVVAVRLQQTAASSGAPLALAISRRVRLVDATFPVRLNTGRAPPLASGASIRLPPERAAVYLTARDQAGIPTVFRVGADDRPSAFGALDPTGIAGAADLSPDGRWLLVPVARLGGVVGPAAGTFIGGVGVSPGRFGVVATPADEHPGQNVIVDLGQASSAASSAAALPAVACQP